MLEVLPPKLGLRILEMESLYGVRRGRLKKTPNDSVRSEQSRPPVKRVACEKGITL